MYAWDHRSKPMQYWLQFNKHEIISSYFVKFKEFNTYSQHKKKKIKNILNGYL